MINVGVLQAVLQLKNSMSPDLKKAVADVDAAGQKMQRAGTALLPLTAVIAGIGFASLKFASDFDKAMTGSIAIMGELSVAMRDKMETTAREVAKSTTFSAVQAAEAYFLLSSAGLDAATSIEAMPKVAMFAQAGLFDMAQATDLLTDAQSALGLTIRDTATGAIDTTATMQNLARVSDVLVKANTLANASVEQFSVALTTKAGVALRILGKDIEEGVAVLAAFADQGVKAQLAGTGLNIILRDLSTKAIKNKAAFDELGVSVFDANGKMNNIGAIVSDLEVALAGMSNETAKATLLQLGFADKSVSFIQTLIGMGDQIQRYEEQLRSAGGATEEVATIQLQSFSAQMEMAKSRLIDIGIELGTALIPMVLNLLDALDPVIDVTADAVKWFGELNGTVQVVAVGVAAFVAALGPALISIGFMASGVSALIPVLAALKVAAIAAGGAISGLFAASGGLAAVLTGTLLPAIAALTAGAGIGFAIFKFLEWAGAIDKVEEKTRRLVAEMGPSAQQAKALADASAIAGREITSWSEATAILNDHILKLREGNENLRPRVSEVGDAVERVTVAAQQYSVRAKEAASATLDWSKVSGELPSKLTEQERASLAAALALGEHNLLLERAAEQAKELGIRTSETASSVSITTAKVKDLGLGVNESTDFTKEWADILSETRGVMNLLGIDADSTAGKIVAAFSKVFDTFNSILGIVGKIAGAFSSEGGLLSSLGSLAGGGGGIGSLLGVGGSTAAASAIPLATAGVGTAGGVGAGAAAGGGGGFAALGGLLTNPITGIVAGIGAAAFFALRAAFKEGDAETTADFLGFDFDAISSDLQSHLQAMGEQIGDFSTALQLNLGQIISEGGLAGDLDAMAEKVADTFSFLERGQITSAEAQQILNDTVGQLLPVVDQMGAEGVFQLERLLASAEAAGVGFDDMQALAVAYVMRAQELGIAVNNVALEALGLEDALALLGQTGEVALDGAQTALEETAASADDLRFSFERAAAAARGIHVPGGGGGGGDRGFQFGTPRLDFANFGPETFVPVHGKEAVIPQGGGHALAAEIAAALGGSAGGGVHVDLRGSTFSGSPEQNAKAIERMIVDGMRNGGKIRNAINSGVR